jgi:putative ABC transport system ATP-binding protein
MMDYILEFKSVSYQYAENAHPILKNASFQIKKGDFVLIKGASGAGKSTLLRLCCRLEEPNAGVILLKGVSLNSIEPPLLRKRICYVQQTPTLAPGSIGKNLKLAFTFKSSQTISPPSKDMIRALLDEFQLSDFGQEDSAMSLSVGQKQRVCLIRTILMEPEIMLLDEPTSALDAKSAAVVLNRAKAVNREKKITILMVTHGKEELGLDKQKILEVNDGKVLSI